MNKNNPFKLLYWPFLTIRAKKLASLISPHLQPHKKILDVGAGNMLVSKYVSENTHAEVQGIDVLDMNLTELPHQLFNGEVIPFDDKEYDYALLIGVLHHVEKQNTLLKEVTRVTKKRIIIFEDTYANNIEKQWVKIRDVLGNLPEELQMSFALKFHSEKEWETLFSKLGMKVAYKKTFFNFLWFTHHTLYVLERI